MDRPLPYQVAVLCYLFDEQARVLLIHRRRPPNQDLYSPIGGKLQQPIGESPVACAVREIGEETGLRVDVRNLHLTGIISEAGYENQSHWLMFLYEVTTPVCLTPVTNAEGTLQWYSREQINELPIPSTDRQVIWPLFWRYRGHFFAAHICCQDDKLIWRIEQPASDVT